MGFVVTEEDKMVFFNEPEMNIQKSLNTIKSSVDYLIRDNNALRATLKKYDTESEIRAKEEEIKSIRQRAITVLSPVEFEHDKEFRDRHYQSCKNGGHFIYDIAGTGFGTIVKVKCPVCGLEEDITDVNSW